MRKAWGLPIALILLAGCNRWQYRNQADGETYAAIQQHVVTPPANIGRTLVEPDPTSRLADPFDPNCVPKPPDDPSAALFMQKPGGLRGSKRWEAFGQVDAIEQPGWEASLGLDAKGVLKLDQNKSAEIALKNSREYQTAVEDVYLTALSLTLNRFEFSTQWFGRTGPVLTRVGTGDLPLGSNNLSVGAEAGFNRNLAAGGQLLVDFANSFVWEFSGRTSSVTGNFGATLIQPLLRNFGRDVRLEVLTQAERDTLYVVRDFARFRKAFWSGIAVQDDGYLDLLLQVQAVRNAKENLKAQEENYRLSQELFKGNKRSVVEVDQSLQGLLSARQQILDSEIGLENALDRFKRRLGLPPRLPVELDDEPLKEFVLVDPEVQKLREELTDFERLRKSEFGAVPDADVLKRGFDQLAKYLERTGKALDFAEKDLGTWKSSLEKTAKTEGDKEASERAAETYKLNATVPEEGRKLLKLLAKTLAEHREATSGATRPESWEKLVADMKKLGEILDSAINAQTLSRIYRIDLPGIDATEPDAITFAKTNRLDLQNQQARVTDAWRKVIVAANRLQSDLTVTAGVNLLTGPEATHPFAFNSDYNRYTLGVQFDGPLNRQAERNAYRASQIGYQRARRAYMDLSDSIEQQIRLNLRSLRQARVSFEIARQQLIAAARQVENERSLLNAPKQQQGTGDATLRTLQALSQLNAARNNLAGTFIRYEQLRVQLLLNLEALQLDERGFPTNASPDRNPLGSDRVGPRSGPAEVGVGPPLELPPVK